MIINTNQSALNAQRQLNATSHALGTSFERLSSGLRVNGAKDDAAGLSISTRMTAQVQGVNQAIRNSNDGISLAQTIEGALNETTQILQRMRELSVQAVNGTNNDSDRRAIQAEIVELKEEVDRIADTTTFNDRKVLDGNFLAQNIQVGANGDESFSVSVGGASSKDLGRQARYSSPKNFVAGLPYLLNTPIRINGTTVRTTTANDDQKSTFNNAQSAIARAIAINESSHITGVYAIAKPTKVTLGTAVGAVTLTGSTYITVNDVKVSGFAVEDGDASGSLVDALNEVSDETGVVASINSEGRLTLIADDGRNIDYQTYPGIIPLGRPNNADVDGANVSSNLRLMLVAGGITLHSEESFELANSSGYGLSEGVYGVNSEFSVDSLDVSSTDGANLAIETIDLALKDITEARSEMGALQNRLESTISNLSTTSENLSAARSRIIDADFAAETAALSKNQIVQQAGVSILAQANQQTQIALDLLR
jgi:flagellin